MRHKFIQQVTIAGCLVVAITELLSLLGRIQRVPLLACWVVVGIYAIPQVRWRKTKPSFDPFVFGCGAACVVILALTGITALISPPNSSDAMAYHMPRVIFWAQEQSVRYFPTPYLNQIMLQPFAEYVMLHLYVLTNGDRFTNLVQWFASAVSIVAVSSVAARLGASARGQAIAALFCATIPIGILASSGAKNDYVLATWMVIAVCFALQLAESRQVKDGVFLGAAVGLALLTKATAYLFLPWLLAAIFIARWRSRPQAILRAGLAGLVCAIALNAPHFVRNYNLSGSILGFDSAHANGLFRWRNEAFGWKVTASNAARNLSEQVGARSTRWNQNVYEEVLAFHRGLGMDSNDPSTTWRWAQFTPPRNANHEADAPNRWQLALLILIASAAGWQLTRGRDRTEAIYMAALLCGFLAFCAYLKWQPFMARMFLPLYVAAAPVVGVVLGKRSLWWQIPLCLFLLDNSRLPLLQNWVRPLQGTHSILHANRDDLYFADMTTWNNQDSYVQAAAAIAQTGCNTVGVDINVIQLEYPLLHLIRERQPSAQFVHTAVDNPSRTLPPPTSNPPCVIACLDCAGDTSRLALYKDFPKSAVFGKFVVLSALPATRLE